ncbi:hypothetical protein Ctob_002953 [Chrysochromulina tobinii]|uniref:Uncharacterized protein n=1 Tax=Chrysochromulina tobinii TaxID=1460289 RepID=A0A0M0J737_9EUKA|nr:hypothetical protein Ctob_002953 [Chrysochromulina tobinii]|eukprot:KOO22033.1 hypothetical protein Ctob_002953 [Chrysochromulina sp. CCMP291]
MAPRVVLVLVTLEVVDKLNAVPVFSIVNGAEQMVQTPDKESGNVAEASIEVRLQAARAEMESVRGLLKKSPVPPLLRRRNVLQGPIPLFGSDQIRFQLPPDPDPDPDRSQIRFQRPAGTAAAADAADEKEEESTMLPLFFRRSDLHVAWVASGGSIDSLPAVQGLIFGSDDAPVRARRS